MPCINIIFESSKAKDISFTNKKTNLFRKFKRKNLRRISMLIKFIYRLTIMETKIQVIRLL